MLDFFSRGITQYKKKTFLKVRGLGVVDVDLATPEVSPYQHLVLDRYLLIATQAGLMRSFQLA